MADREVKLVYKITDEGTIRTLDEIRTKVKAVGEGVEVSTRAAGEGFNRFQTSVITASQAINIAQTAFNGLRQVVDGVTESIGRVDNYGELARAIGLSVEELTSMRVAAKQGGVELGELGRSVSFLQRELIRAAQGGGKAKLFEQLGITPEELRDVQSGTRSTVSVMAELGRAFEGLSKAQQVALSRELFGRGGGRLLNVLTADLEKQIGVARELGAVISEDMAGAADEAANSLDTLAIASQSLQDAIGVKLAPTVDIVAGKLTQWTNETRQLVETDFAGWIQGIGDAAATALNGLGGFGAALGTIAKVGAAYIGGAARAEENASPTLEINSAVRAVASRTPSGRVIDLGGGSRKSGGGGGGPSDSDRSAERQRLEEERRILESLTERERIRVALAEREVELRDNAVNRAKEDLDLAKEYGATEDQQVVMAQRLDELEQLRLVSVRDRLRAELDGLLQFGPVIDDQVIALETRMDVVDDQISRSADSAERLRREFEKSKDAVDTIGDALDNSLQRAVDGLLSQNGGNFNLGNVIVGTLRAQVSTLVGQAIKGGISSLLGGTTASASVAGGGLFGDVVGGGSSTAAAGGSGGLGAGAGAGLGAGVAGLAPLATAAAAAYLGASLIGGLGVATNPTKNITLQNQVSTTGLRQDSGLFGPGAIAAAVVVPIIGQFYAIIAAIVNAFISAPSRGAQLKIGIGKSIPRSFPRQDDVELGGQSGIRTQFLEASPTQAEADIFAGLGYTNELFSGLNQTIESVPKARRALLGDIQTAQRERPGVDKLRYGAALGLGTTLAFNSQGSSYANTLINNLLLTGVSEDEARRQLLAVAEKNGVTFSSGVENIQNRYQKGRFRDDPRTAAREDLEQFKAGITGLADLFKDDFPVGVDVAAIAIANFTEKAGLDIANFTKDVDRAVEIFGALRDTTEAGLKTGLGSSLSAFATRNGLIAGGGSIADIVKANNRGRAEVVSALFESISSGLSTAITEGVFDAVKETPAWDALSQAIANAVGGANIADLPQLIGGVITTALPALNAAAETISQIQAVIGVTPTSLTGRADAIGQRIENVRYGRLNPNQQEKFLRTRLSQIDAELATTNDPIKRRELLDERADIAFKGAELAGSRYAPGSAAGERAVNQWLLVAENTRQQFESFSKDQLDQIDAINANTEALNRNTEALNSNGPVQSTVIIESDPGHNPRSRRTRPGQSHVPLNRYGDNAVDQYFASGQVHPTTRAAIRQISSGK